MLHKREENPFSAKVLFTVKLTKVKKRSMPIMEEI
jgi:hypothetical protein